MKPDMIQWLRDTGGQNAIARFNQTAKSTAKSSETSESKSSNSTSSTTAKDTVELSKSEQFQTMSKYDQFGKMVGGVNYTTPGAFETIKKAIEESAAPKKKSTDTNTVKGVDDKNPQNKNTAEVKGDRNVIDYSEGDTSNRENKIKVQGQQNSVRSYSGGHEKGSVDVEGSRNRVMTGQDANSNMSKVQGDSNYVNFTQGSSNNDVSLKGNHNTVQINHAPNQTGGNSGWKVAIEGDHVGVSVVDGKAYVSMSEEQKNQYRVDINEEAKTIDVKKLAQNAA